MVSEATIKPHWDGDTISNQGPIYVFHSGCYSITKKIWTIIFCQGIPVVWLGLDMCISQDIKRPHNIKDIHPWPHIQGYIPSQIMFCQAIPGYVRIGRTHRGLSEKDHIIRHPTLAWPITNQILPSYIFLGSTQWVGRACLKETT